MYKLLKQEGRAKRAEVTTVHGTIQTPVFMNVGTVAAIKGAVSTADLEEIGTKALFPRKIWNRSVHRWNSPIRIISMSGQAMRRSRD